MRIMRQIKNQKGSITIMLASLILMSIFIYSILLFLQNSRQQVENAARSEAKKSIIDQRLALLRNEFIFNYSLQNHNTAAQNPNLKTCMLAPGPTDASCINLNIDFYQPLTAGDEKFAGGTASPVYTNIQGQPCVDSDNNPTDLCTFKITTTCQFTCPSGQALCPLNKLIACDLQISSYGSHTFKDFSYIGKSKTFAANYAIRISNDLTTFSVVK